MFRILFRNNTFKKNVFGKQMYMLGFEGILLRNLKSTVVCYETIRKDNSINRKSFFKEKQLKMMTINENSYEPKNFIKKFDEDISNQLSIKSCDFIDQILVPLENGNEKLIKLVKDDVGVMSFLISLCGKVMNDIDIKKRNIILNRLCEGLEKNNLKFNLNAINAKLKILSENDVYFDVNGTLYDLEKVQKIEPNEEFINLMMIQIAKCGRKEELENFKEEIVKKNYKFDDKIFELAMIRCVSVREMYNACDKLIENFINKYGAECEKDALYQVLLSTSQQLDLQIFNEYLKRLINLTNDNNKYRMKNYLTLDKDVVMDIIWNFGMKTSSNNEMTIKILIEELLANTKRSKNFFKLLYREIQRHINEEYYYTAVAMICNTSKEKKSIFYTNSKVFSNLSKEILNSMVKNGINEEKIKYIANRIATFAGVNYRVFDDLAYSIVTSKNHKSYEKLDMFLSFIDDIDPERQRTHLIFPFMVDEESTSDKLQLLFRWKNAGYNNLSDLNIHLISRYLISPFLEKSKYERSSFCDFKHLDMMKKIFKSFNIDEITTWKWMLNIKNMLEPKGSHHNFPISIKNITLWLKDTYDESFNNEKDNDIKVNENDLKRQLEEYMEDKNIYNIHRLMIDPVTYRKIDVSPYVDKILELYLQFGYWGQIMTLLTNISNYCRPIDDREEILTSKQIIQILQRCILTMNDITKLKEQLYDIKRKFPLLTLASQDYQTTLDETKQLIELFFNYNKERKLSIDDVNNFQVILTTLYQLDIIDLPTNEAITPLFVKKVLHQCGWNIGVKMWYKFQNQILCSNSLISLFDYALSDYGDQYQLYYLMLKAQAYMTKSRINAYYVGALSSTTKNKNIINDIVKNFKEPMKTSDVLHVFRLLNSMYKNFNFNTVTFLEVSLENTKFIECQTTLNLLINNCLIECENKNLGLLALRYQNIFTKYGYEFNEVQKKRVTNLNSKSDKLFEKWIFDKTTGVLNVP